MSRRLNRDIRDWLDAEHASGGGRAEEAFARAINGLGRRAPRPGFADRVVFATGRFTPAISFWRSRWVRAAVVASLASAGLAVVALPVLLLVVEPLARAFGMPIAVGASRWTVNGLVRAFAVWNVVGDLASALRASLATRQVFALLVANALVAASSLMGLKRLLRAPEELTP